MDKEIPMKKRMERVEEVLKGVGNYTQYTIQASILKSKRAP